MSRSRSVSSACSIKFHASQSCGIKTMGRVPRLALERGRYQGEPEHYLPHRTQGTEKREGPALYPEEQNRQPYPSASRISCSDLEPSSDATSDLEPSSHSTPRSAEWFPRQPRGGPRDARDCPISPDRPRSRLARLRDRWHSRQRRSRIGRAQSHQARFLSGHCRSLSRAPTKGIVHFPFKFTPHIALRAPPI